VLNESGSGSDQGAGRKILAMGPFRLDECAAMLYRGREALPVGRRAVALLGVLAKHPGIIVSKDKLIEAAWPGIAVEESNLTVQVAALRRALASEPGAEGWIETMPRRGYRYIGPVSRYARSGVAGEDAHAFTIGPPNDLARDDRPGAMNGGPVSAMAGAADPSSCLVGRAASLGLVERLAECVIAGQRKVVFVSGEAGIGKTAFVESAVAQLARQGLDLLYGRCTERFGTDEAFLPLIDALVTRSRQPNGLDLLTAMRTHAPTWMLQMPGVNAKERAAFQEEVFGATRERMVREFCDLMEVMSADRPWVIVLEDLHWCDLATLDVLSRFARGTERAGVLILGSYRPANSAVGGHPIRRLHQDLEIHGRCEALPLDRLSRSDVEQYLSLRFADKALASTMAEAVFERTQGHPLFISSLLKHILDQGVLVREKNTWRLTSDIAIIQNEVPDDLVKMIRYQLDNLTQEERNLLNVASAAGVEFSAALVAAGLSRDTVEVERDLEALARNDLVLLSSGVSEWPDGAYSGAYSFRHILYQNVLYQQLAPGLRAQTHRRLGQRLEEAYSGRTQEIAAALAFHFEQGRDFARALRYLGQAAENSTKRLGHEEAINYLTRALDILDRSGGADQHKARIALLRQRSWARRSAGDLVGSVGDLRQMIACTAAAGELRQEVSGLLAVSRFTLHADRRVCLQASQEALTKSEALDDDAFRALVRGISASTNLWLKGWQEQDAALCEEALRVTAGARDHGTLIRRYGIEGILECLRSRYDACRRSGTDGKRLAQEVGDVYIFVLFNVMESTALIHLGQWRRLQQETAAALALAERNANRPAIALCRLTLAWLHVEAMDFDGARDLCERVDATVLEENPFAFFFQRAVLAKAFVGMNESRRALNQFESVKRRLDSDGIMLDYTIYAQLQHCLGEYSLHVGDTGQARRAADELRDHVARAPDLNHLAQALGLLARIAFAAGDWDEAQAHLSRGLSIVETTNFPLAAWRVYDSAAEILGKVGETDKAATFRRRFADILSGLAENFSPDDRLNKSLRSAMTNWAARLD
jgi:DNA-binding winged helix-turn-helix (wHTH) protein/tetratricopeptide (TPR) repeat protein